MRTYRVRAPEPFPRADELPDLDVATSLSGAFDYLHVFARAQDELVAEVPTLIDHLAVGGMLWVSWPKARQLGTDLTLHEVARICYAAGVVESTAVSLDPTWSALKFTRPKPGKKYANNHGPLAR